MESSLSIGKYSDDDYNSPFNALSRIDALGIYDFVINAPCGNPLSIMDSLEANLS
jgi:hypothetical protein